LLGDIANFCCNVLTVKDEATIVQSNEELKKYVNKVVGAVADDHKSLIKVSEHINNIETKEVQVVQEMRDQISRLKHYAKVEHRFVLESIAELYNRTSMNMQLSSYKPKMDRKIQALRDCRSNLFPLSILDQNVFQKDLTELESKLNKEN